MIRELLRGFYNRLRNLKAKKIALSKVKNHKGTTYFPERQQKNAKTQKKELRVWAKKYGEYNEFYYLYGFDVSNENQNDYQDYRSFMAMRNKANSIGSVDCQAVLLRDKFLFFKYMQSCGLDVPEVFAFIEDGECFDANCGPISWNVFNENKDFFLKDNEGECASFVKHIASLEDLNQYKERLYQGRYICQRKVVQSKEMNAIYPKSINTYRIVTINKNGKPYIFSAVLRVGTSISGNVDNWAAGGLVVGIDQQSGYLKEWAFFKPKYGGKTTRHPDTDIEFAATKAPCYEEAAQLALKAARCFYNIRAIGWDVAITENGPTIIEGNDNWEISLIQACDGPLREKWFEAIK